MNYYSYQDLFYNPEPCLEFYTPNLRNFQNHVVTVEHATSPEAIRKGLMFRKDSLKPNNGMLFHTGKKYNSFWMKNTYIPLDVIFLDETFKIIGFVENNKPLSLEPIYIEEPSNYVLEMNAGWVKRRNAKLGDEIKIK
jgi:uncharacterized membrane protein (UPF0127 family)